MKMCTFAIALTLSPLVFAEDSTTTSLSLPDMYCQVDQFGPAANAAPTPPFKKCDSLKDAKEVKIGGSGACKAYALEKMGSCMKKMGAVEKVAVRWKFIEKFKNTSNTNKYTCELDKAGENSCP